MALKKFINIGTSPNDGTGDQPRTAFAKIGAPYSTTYVANQAQFGGATAEAIITNTISAAVTDGATVVLIPQVDNTASPPITMFPHNPALITYNSAVRMAREGGDPWVCEVDAYGASGGTSDDTAVIKTAIAGANGLAIVRGTPGKTYLVNTSYAGLNTPADAQKLLFVNVDNTVLDFTGATLKNNSPVNITNGSDSNGLGVLNILGNDCVVRGKIDCNSKAKFALCLQDNKAGTRLDCTIVNPIETAGFWSAIIGAVSVDLKGSAVSTRHTNTSGFLKRPSCPRADNTNTITGHGDVTAVLPGANTIIGNSLGPCLVAGFNGTGVGNSLMCIRTDIIGVPQFVFANDANAHFEDLVCHDLGGNVIEGSGTSVTNSIPYGLVNSDTLGFAVKNASAHAYGHANLGSDSTSPSMVTICRAAGQAEVDFDYNPSGGLAGGRVIYKQTSPTTLATGLDARNQDQVFVTLTGALLVAAPTSPRKGQRIIFIFVQDGTGGRAVTWNAVFKTAWSDTGNTSNKRSSIEYLYDGTNWTQVNAQSPYI